jgi:hypothetical protein
LVASVWVLVQVVPHIACPVGQVATPLVLLGIAVASYALRPASRTLGAPLLAEQASPTVLSAAAKAS